MGIDDCDYMRERYRERQGKATGSTFWNDRKSRVEQPHDKHGKAVPLGSGSWVGGGWFDTLNCGQDYKKARYRPRRSKLKKRDSVSSFLLEVVLKIGLAVAVPYVMYRVYIATIIPALQAMVPVPFPAHGSVYVTPETDIDRRQGLIHFKAPQAISTSYVVMLHDMNRGHDVLGVFVASGRKTRTPVPVGTYRVRIVEGNTGTWRGFDRLFGATVGRELMQPLTIVQATDKTVDRATPLAHALTVRPNSNVGFVDP